MRLPAVIERTGLSRSTLYRLIQSGEFPAPVRLARRCVGWPTDSVDSWLRSRLSEDNTRS
ncbi:helix-turn-helix transcriptional regulator [Thiohalobacter thiocyanaticus]|nr:AlpA family phage regulatory protein [Thiohalobacter thiocyanaticus]